MDRVARKLPSTGNGKCNYTNALQGVSFYRGEDPAFVMPVFAQFGLPETLAFFQELGIRPKERNGYYYPSSGQASSIPEVLCMEARYRKVSIVTSCVIRHIRKRRGGFEILTDGAAYFAKTVIFATGLLAAPKTGSDGSAFPLITSLGHHFVEVVPALVQLEAGQKILKEIMQAYESKEFGGMVDGRRENIVDVVSSVLARGGMKVNGEFQMVGKVAVYPMDYFCCFNFETQGFEITDNTVSIHHYFASWTSWHSKLHFKIIKVVAAVLGKERYLSLKRRIKGTGTSK